MAYETSLPRLSTQGEGDEANPSISRARGGLSPALQKQAMEGHGVTWAHRVTTQGGSSEANPAINSAHGGLSPALPEQAQCFVGIGTQIRLRDKAHATEAKALGSGSPLRGVRNDAMDQTPARAPRRLS